MIKQIQKSNGRKTTWNFFSIYEQNLKFNQAKQVSFLNLIMVGLGW